MVSHSVSWGTLGPLLHGGDVRAPAEVFNSIFEVFLVLGTVVGVFVVVYTLYHAVKYRATDDSDPFADTVDRPRLGELPAGGSGGRKVFLSLGISAVIVVSLIGWTYMELSYIEDGPEVEGEEDIRITVEGYQFGWTFVYPNGYESTTLRVPRNRVVRLDVTSRDVFHNFGIPAFRVKADAIPGRTTSAWFTAEKTGTYEANCYELCGSGHSLMATDVEVMPQDAYTEWYSGTEPETTSGSANDSTSAEAASGTETPTGGGPA
ncbi:cytochrome c oxidase subunit II [Haloarcula sp. S1CR25-12]|uniref:Cytochrome c oxidase subunit II n=1 Tax=Haloarcula saliterrae TaxID=2950534 RepID=A0ABU2FF41_9EURY|nr:cytochrome c oxidase subunit II [Haloarcula sp. S1CR25-12]MDS0260876.1 cytochrome c oxidase subunit II [Haloarcula sp. S1CR25-12]